MRSKLIFLSITILFLTLFSSVRAATYVVDRADDVTATACTAAANDCSLRGAIVNANANGAGADTINFNVGGGNAQTITLTATPLPDIQTSLTIDGTTQPLWGGPPLIEINGAASAANTSGFRISSPASSVPITVAIKSLIINRFTGSGIFFNASSGVTATVTGCYIGVNPGGSIDLGNGNDGIRIFAYPDSTFTIGGTATSDRNVISGNQSSGINVVSALGFQNAGTTVTVLNNFIGTSAGGNVDLGNVDNGISFGGPGFGYSLQVGNGLANGRNVISGNDKIGIAGTSGAVTIVNNYIGTSFNGNVDVGNTLDGIQLGADVANAQIGGTVLGIPVGNLISGNDRDGIWINDASIPAVIRNNKIGTNAAGTGALGNGSDGIFLFENDALTTSAIVIGSATDPGDGNTISGNGGDGIDVDSLVAGVKIYGNKIGVNALGGGAVPNAVTGIRLLSGNNEIGLAGNDTAANIISGNLSGGMLLAGAQASNNKIYNNFIGTNVSGANVGNAGDGIYINQSAAGNQIGNATTAGGNKIVFNTGNGINVSDGQTNSIRGNSIYSNGALGIDLNSDGVTNNDPNDPDSGPNGLQNFPIIQTATPTRITGVMNSIPSIQYKLDFYSSDSCDATGNGEGRTYLGSGLITTSVNGSNSFAYTNQFAVTAGQIITATATDASGNTSEFSPCVTATPPLGDVSFSSATYTTNEGGGQKTIVVSRTGGSFGTISVDYYTFNSSALAGQDYTAAIGTLTFNNGEVIKSFNVSITDDLLDEFDDEYFYVELHNASTGVFTGISEGTVTIIDNDNPPTVNIGDVTSPEGNPGFTPFNFTVGLSAPSGKPVTVDFTTASGTATASSDFASTNGQVTFAPGENLKNIPVSIIGDLTPELDETFNVNLSNPVNATFSDSQGVGTIVDDDNPGKFSFAFAPYSGTEHQSVQVTVTRTNGTAGTVSVDYSTQGGTATPLTDYQPATGTLVFGDGETTKTFFVTITDDNVPEPAETVNLVLSNPIGGTTLGAPSTAVLNITDDDNGTLLNLAGIVRRADNTPVGGVTMTLQGTQNATATTDTNGRYTFANLAPNGNYSVTPAALGYTFLPISQQFNNLAADNLAVNFTATAAPARQLRIVGGNATPGQNVSATVQLVAQGDENSVGFSINFDPALLSSPQLTLGADALAAQVFTNTSQVASGKLGILLAMPAGQAFAVGTRSLVTVTFNTVPTNAYNSPVTFGDAPIARGVTNTNADELSASYLDGAVTFAQGFEADVAPRPTGNNNGTITISDFTQVGRFVAGLDTLNANFNEFQRADCAPRITLGNGTLTVADYTQAGRYAASLDTISPTGGAAAPNLLNFDETGKLLGIAPPAKGGAPNFVPTVVRVVNAQALPGSQVVVSIEADATGTENGFGFTLNYDPAKLSAPLVQKGADTQTATLIPNVAQAGRVGVVLGMPFGDAVPAGTRQIVTVRFNVAANATGGPTPLVFSDTPVVREISDINANVLQSTFTDGSLNILAPTAASVIVGGRVSDARGGGLAQVRVTLTGAGGQTRTAQTNSFGNYRFTDVAAGETYIVTVTSRRYVFVNPTRVVTVGDNLEDVDFVGQN